MEMMNMTTSSGMNVTLPVMEMMPFHTVVGMDMLWFASWMPSDAASTFGACVGLFFLAVFHRLAIAFAGVKGIRSTANETWATQNLNKLNKFDKQQPLPMRYPAFSLKMDLSMGLLEGLISFVGYALMLAVMVMNAWFFIAIILGIIVGETSFGRFKRCYPIPGAYMDTSECC